MNKRTTAIVYTLLALGLLIIIVLAARGGSSTASPSETADGTVPAVAQITDTDHTKGGTQTAPATLIEYADFQCPACSAYDQVVSAISDQFGNRLRLVFRHYPLTQIHRNAMQASYSAEAAGLQGKFWEMHDLLFARQNDWSSLSAASAKETFLNYAIELGLDGAQFKEDVDSDVVKEKIAKDTSTGNQLGVRGTPSFFLNGVAIDNPGSAQEFIDVIEAAIGDKEVAPMTEEELSQSPQADVSARLAVFIQGEQQDINLPSTSGYDIATLEENGHVMHATREGVTVGYVFTSYGMNLTNDCFTTAVDEAFCTDDERSLKFFVNGKRVQSLATYEFNNQDTVLISYGPLVDNTLAEQLAAVSNK